MKIRKQAITLLEIMIVIFIIGIIGSVIGYNMKGSMDEGRAYRSEHGSKQVHDLLSLEFAKSDKELQEILGDPTESLDRTGFVSNPAKLMKDGWGQEYKIERLNEEEFTVRSEKWGTFLQTKKKMNEEKMKDDYPWAFGPPNKNGSDNQGSK